MCAWLRSKRFKNDFLGIVACRDLQWPPKRPGLVDDVFLEVLKPLEWIDDPVLPTLQSEQRGPDALICGFSCPEHDCEAVQARTVLLMQFEEPTEIRIVSHQIPAYE